MAVVEECWYTTQASVLVVIGAGPRRTGDGGRTVSKRRGSWRGWYRQRHTNVYESSGVVGVLVCWCDRRDVCS